MNIPIEIKNPSNFKFSGPSFESAESNKVIQKLDKIIELLEELSKKDEHIVEKGMIKENLPSFSDWQVKLDDI